MAYFCLFSISFSRLSAFFSSLIERLTLAVARGIISVVLILFILLLFFAEGKGWNGWHRICLNVTAHLA